MSGALPTEVDAACVEVPREKHLSESVQPLQSGSTFDSLVFIAKLLNR